MTLAHALRDHDLGALGRDLTTAALHQDRCRRHAERVAIPADFPETRRAVANIDTTVQALSAAERLVADVSRVLADERAGQPPSDGAPPRFVEIGGRRIDLHRVADLLEQRPDLVQAVVAVEQPARPRGAPEGRPRQSLARALTSGLRAGLGPVVVGRSA